MSLLLDFGRMGLEEKPATGRPLPKGKTGKRTVQKELPFRSLDMPSCHQSTPDSRSVWRKRVTSSHTSLPVVLHAQTQQVNKENNMELAVGINAVQTHCMTFFQKLSSLAIIGRELKLGRLLKAALYFSSAG